MMTEDSAGEVNLPRAPSLLWCFGTGPGCQFPSDNKGWGVRGEVPVPPPLP